ncbi:hypothetical protein [Duganella hordei]|uniref:hypothetical protein n=1 Tax=Duganella hordei TaxID=2865934 RepID=UPI003340953C
MDLDNAGKYSHALTAVLYAARKAGCDLNGLLSTVKQDIISNSLRPLPQHQEAVISALAEAIRDLE